MILSGKEKVELVERINELLDENVDLMDYVTLCEYIADLSSAKQSVFSCNCDGLYRCFYSKLLRAYTIATEKLVDIAMDECGYFRSGMEFIKYADQVIDDFDPYVYSADQDISFKRLLGD